MNYVYILECGDGSLYTGWTNHLEKRIKDHGEGKGAKYTRSRLPLKLVYSEEHSSPREARKREAQIKKFSRKEKLLLLEKHSELLFLAEEKLRIWQQPFTKLSLMREKQNIALFRLENGEEHFVLKLFLTTYGREELFFYELLKEEGIPTLFLKRKDDEAMLMEDLEFSETLRLATEEDMEDPQIMRELGKWYQRLHSMDVKKHLPLPTAEEWTQLSTKRLCEVKDLYQENASWEKLYPLLEAFLEKVKELPLRLCYNDFYFVNMVVEREGTTAFMMDYGSMALNYPGVDLVNALWFSKEKSRTAFRENYGLQWEREGRWTQLLLPLMEFFAEPNVESHVLTEDYYKEMADLLEKKDP